MKHTLLIITALLFITSTVIPQSKVNINNLVEYGGKMFKQDDDKPYTGLVFDLYRTTGNKSLEGRYKDGLRNGKWSWWNVDNKMDSSGTYKDGEKVQWTYYNQDGWPNENSILYSSDEKMIGELGSNSISVGNKVGFQAHYFTEYIRRFLEREDDELGVNIYRDGLKIYTTLDSRLQTIAEDAVYKSVIANQQKLNQRLFNDEEEFSKLAYLGIYPEDTVKLMMAGEMELYEDLRDKLLVQSSFVALDTRTGGILAMVGGRPDYHDQFNRVSQAKRQPGSVFNPFIYTTAIDNGVPVTRQLLNQPVVLNVRDAHGEWVKWMPKNYDGSSGGLTTIREGLRRSLNLISVRLVQELVPAREVVDMAKRMHISTPLRAVDAIALGTSEVHLLEIVAAYGSFANTGVYCKPFGITRIEDRFGNVLKEYNPRREEVLRMETAYLMTNLMQTVMDRGTGGSARWKYHFYHPAAGKSGTTQGWTDAWFVGFTPQIAAGVWFGIDDYQVSLGEGQDGTKVALPAWARFMKTAHDTLNLTVEDFERPSGVVLNEICSVTKQAPWSSCTIEKEIFILGTEPTSKCKIHL